MDRIGLKNAVENHCCQDFATQQAAQPEKSREISTPLVLWLKNTRAIPVKKLNSCPSPAWVYCLIEVVREPSVTHEYSLP